jgi:hypothetical protein
MAERYLTSKALKRVAWNGDLIWNQKALDWPLRATAKFETVDGVRKALLEYLDWMGRISANRTSSEIRREVSRVSRRLCEVMIVLQKMADQIPF